MSRTIAVVFWLMAATVALTSVALCQSAPDAGSGAQNPRTTTGSAPGDKGSTGWTGGSRDNNTGEETAADKASEATQPEMATGLDLKGPAKQFPATKTPE